MHDLSSVWSPEISAIVSDLGRGMKTRARRDIAQPLALVMVIFCCIHAAPAIASPWGQESGALFISSRSEYFRANSTLPSTNGIGATQRFERLESNTYAEFGLTRDILVGAKAVYGSSGIANGSGVQSATGFSEFEGFVQRRLWQGANSVGAIRLAGAAPTRFNTGVRSGLRSDGADAEIRFLYGRNLITRPVKIFNATELGYRRRFGDAADQIRLDALIGVETTSRFLMIVETFSTLSIRNENFGGADFDVFKIQPSVVMHFNPHWSLQAGLTHEAAGRGLDLGNTFFIGLWTSF